MVAYMLVVVMIVATTVVTITQARYSWLWVFPYVVTVATVYGYRRERSAQNLAQGTLWGSRRSSALSAPSR